MNMEQSIKLILEGMQEIKADVSELKTDVAELKSEVGMLKTDVTELKADVAELKTEVSELKTDVLQLKSDMKKTNLHIENVTDVRIQFIAEGHMSLMRRLENAEKVSELDKIRDVRIGVLEKEVGKIKEKLNMCPA